MFVWRREKPKEITEIHNAWALVISLLRYSFVFYILRHTHLVKSDHISYGKGDRLHYHPRFTPVSDGGGICLMVMFTSACFRHTSHALIQGIALNLQPLRGLFR